MKAKLTQQAFTLPLLIVLLLVSFYTLVQSTRGVKVPIGVSMS